MSEKAAKAIRVVTTPPIMALWMILLLWNRFPAGHAGWAFLFLTILPVLAYPFQLCVPALKAQGRAGQRRLAVIFSLVGYLAGLCCCAIGHGNHTEYMVYLCYLCSGLQTAIFTKYLGIKSSGHAAGTVGPLSILALRLSPWFALGYLILIPVYWSSLKLKRHTLKELLWGTFSTIALALVLNALLP